MTLLKRLVYNLFDLVPTANIVNY
ncbi:uncharacterized protein METZ01_LOCUS252047 [marine metagenome]|uniref:Uncharacterized protein n=1 Tax=marine metagenome TaxID=408172 RepID=A0A382IK07_9ZZZZ